MFAVTPPERDQRLQILSEEEPDAPEVTAG